MANVKAPIIPGDRYCAKDNHLHEVTVTCVREGCVTYTLVLRRKLDAVYQTTEAMFRRTYRRVEAKK